MKIATAIFLCALLTGCAQLGELIDKPEPLPPVVVTPDVPDQPVPNGAYRITHVSANRISWTGPDLPWRTGGSGDVVKSANAEGHLYRANGQGGKWDWIRPNTKQRDFKNIHSGYGVWSSVGEPANGETVTFIACNRHDLTERITIGSFKWVR
jgi:hypothetical protein